METIARQQIENSGMNLTADQMQQALTRANSPAQLYVTYAGAIVAGIFSLLIVAGGLAIFAMMASQQPRFSTMFSMVALAYLPYRLVTCIMTVLVILISTDPSALDFSNLLSTNVGAFMNKAALSRPLYTLLINLDVLTFVEIGLLAYGFSKITRSSFFYGLVAVGSLFALYLVIRMALSLLF